MRLTAHRDLSGNEYEPEPVPSRSAEQHFREVRRRTRKEYSSEEKTLIVLSGQRGEHSIAALCRREGTAESMCCAPSAGLLEAGWHWPSGDTLRQATSDEVKGLCHEMAL